MMIMKDISGQRFGRLVAVSRNWQSPGRVKWSCVCDCGSEKVVAGHDLGRTVNSCGCLQAESRAKHTAPRHGNAKNGAKSPEYTVWASMKSRCNNPKTKCYSSYGGRGIKVCKEWEDDFSAFLSDMGPRPSSDYSIDRINNDGDYEPSNCRWATSTEQSRNKSTNKYITYCGETMSLLDACAKTGVGYKYAYTLLRRHNLSFEEIVVRHSNIKCNPQTLRPTSEVSEASI